MPRTASCFRNASLMCVHSSVPVGIKRVPSSTSQLQPASHSITTPAFIRRSSCPHFSDASISCAASSPTNSCAYMMGSRPERSEIYYVARVSGPMAVCSASYCASRMCFWSCNARDGDVVMSSRLKCLSLNTVRATSRMITGLEDFPCK